MRNADRWKPTKVVRVRQGFAPSPDPKCVSVASRLIVTKTIDAYHPAIRQYASGRLLDLGCGHVPFYEMYRDLVTEVVCVDWAESLHQNELLDHVMNLNNPLKLESEAFDTVLLTDVLEHIYRPAQLLTEVARVLKPQGHLVVGVPFLYWLHEEPIDFHRYTEFALRLMCKEAGLVIKELRPYGGAPEVLMDVVGKCLNEAGLEFLARGFAAASLAAAKSKPVRAISGRTSGLFPLGYTLVAQKVLFPTPKVS